MRAGAHALCELLEITQETANLLSEDLRDWRFSYAVRPVPTL